MGLEDVVRLCGCSGSPRSDESNHNLERGKYSITSKPHVSRLLIY